MLIFLLIVDVVKSCQSLFDFSIPSDIWARRKLHLAHISLGKLKFKEGLNVRRNWTRPLWHATKHMCIMVISLTAVWQWCSRYCTMEFTVLYCYYIAICLFCPVRLVACYQVFLMN